MMLNIAAGILIAAIPAVLVFIGAVMTQEATRVRESEAPGLMVALLGIVVAAGIIAWAALR